MTQMDGFYMDATQKVLNVQFKDKHIGTKSIDEKYSLIICLGKLS